MWQSTLLQTRKDPQASTGRGCLPTQRLPSTTAEGTSFLSDRKNRMVTGELPEAQCGQFRELKTPGGPSHREILQYWDLPLGDWLGFHGKYHTKSPCFQRRRGEGIMVKQAERSVLNTACSQEKLITRASLTWETEIPKSSLVFLAYLKEKKVYTCLGSSQNEGIGSLREWDLTIAL